MPYVIGTAGHIDHGKTTLVKALTGQDTDRLKEEKARGISIELGFAHLTLPDGIEAGVVDVPGHERFIRHMLAGAHGMDLVLFTIAADDGIMPQTQEHLDILHLLGVGRAIVVITKADLATEARLRELEDDVAVLVAGTSLEGSPIVAFSAVSNHGLERLRQLIARELLREKSPSSRGYFRLPVDRVFVMQGHGVVVTGTARSGGIRAGDHVRCLPGGGRFRVRGLQVHGRAVESASWGQRVALNLTGSERAAIERGQVICHEGITTATARIDASLTVLPSARHGVKNGQRVRVHLGTAERRGRILVIGSEGRVGPKETGFAQIVCSEPVLALRGDRFIIRDEAAQRTLGGGIVLHPWARRRRRADAEARERYEILANGDAPALVTLMLDESDDFATPIGPLAQFLDWREEDLAPQIERIEGVRLLSVDGEIVYTTTGKWNALAERLQAGLRNFHRSHPLAPGMEMEEIRAGLPGRVNPRLFRVVIDELEAAHAVVREASLLRLPSHAVRLEDADAALVQRIAASLGSTPSSPPEVGQLERDLAIPRSRLTELLRVMERSGTVVRVSQDIYFLRDTVKGIEQALRERLSDQGEITPASFRDLVGTTRKYAVPLLEYLDRVGVTVRVGDRRRVRRAS
jgi:selenocysteine-specific elongation factor